MVKRRVKGMFGETEKSFLARTNWVKHNESCTKCKEWLGRFNFVPPKSIKNKRPLEKTNKCNLGRRLYLLWQKSYQKLKR